MKIGILTSSRSDFGIYLPLLKILNEDTFFELEIIAFGMHLSKNHGHTINEIKSYNFKKIHEIQTPLINNNSADVAKNIGETINIFSTFWANNNFDYIFSFGDRYEMFAAVTSSTPFVVKTIHYSAGETTLGAIDNIYRHAISLMSNILFTSTDVYLEKAKQINPEAASYNVGSLSIDNLKNINYLSIDEFKQEFNIDMSKPTILATFHPETVNLEKNIDYIYELLATFLIVKDKYQIIITLPNADTIGDTIKEIILNFGKENPFLIIIESFGMIGYLSCMKHCKFLLGNTSSGFAEASFFPKWVINIGNRQDGRIVTQNIINTPVERQAILKAISNIEKNINISFSSIYGDGKTAEKIVSILKIIKLS